MRPDVLRPSPGCARPTRAGGRPGLRSAGAGNASTPAAEQLGAEVADDPVDGGARGAPPIHLTMVRPVRHGLVSAPGMSDRARVAEQVDDVKVERGDEAQHAPVDGGLAGVHDDPRLTRGRRDGIEPCAAGPRFAEPRGHPGLALEQPREMPPASELAEPEQIEWLDRIGVSSGRAAHRLPEIAVCERSPAAAEAVPERPPGVDDLAHEAETRQLSEDLPEHGAAAASGAGDVEHLDAAARIR